MSELEALHVKMKNTAHVVFCMRWSLSLIFIGLSLSKPKPLNYLTLLYPLPPNDSLFFTTSASKLNKPSRQETSESVRYPLPSPHGRRLIRTHTVHSNSIWSTWPECEERETSSFHSIHSSFSIILRCQRSKSWIWIRIGRNLILERSISLRLVCALFHWYSYTVFLQRLSALAGEDWEPKRIQRPKGLPEWGVPPTEPPSKKPWHFNLAVIFFHTYFFGGKVTIIYHN